jgi:hypothetical protein
MTTATRYSGFLTIKCRMDDFDDVHCTVSHGKNVIGRVKTRPPRSGVTDPKTRRRVADDSAVAFDQYAHAALSFVSDSDAEEADMIESLAEFTDSGYAISRRKPAKRPAAKNGSSKPFTAAERETLRSVGAKMKARASLARAEELAALARFAARHGRTWKAKLLTMRSKGLLGTSYDSTPPADAARLVALINRIGPSRIKSLRLAETNGRDGLRRTKLACARRARATRKGSSKAASRLAKYCPKRRSRKAK